MSHILLAEDEAISAMVFANFLRRKGHRVTVARNGEAALAAFAQDPADLLVTDMNMPGMGGAELLARLRRDVPNLPVMVITGQAGELDGVRPDARTVVLHKPIDPTRVLDQATLMAAA